MRALAPKKLLGGDGGDASPRCRISAAPSGCCPPSYRGNCVLYAQEATAGGGRSPKGSSSSRCPGASVAQPAGLAAAAAASRRPPLRPRAAAVLSRVSSLSFPNISHSNIGTLRKGLARIGIGTCFGKHLGRKVAEMFFDVYRSIIIGRFFLSFPTSPFHQSLVSDLKKITT